MVLESKKLLKRLFLAIILIITLVFATIYVNILYYGHSSKPLRSDVIIVLGCHINGRNPSLTLEYRLREALELYKSGFAEHIIVSGGQGANEIISEASAMKTWLSAQGINKDMIIEENKSSNTYENVKFSKDIMLKNNFKSAIIISNDFHIFRSLKIAKKLNVTASGAPAPTVWYLKLYYQAREILSVIKGVVLDRM